MVYVTLKYHNISHINYDTLIRKKKKRKWKTNKSY
jgi:hypothetical protein